MQPSLRKAHADEASSLVLTRFTNGLVKSRPLKENGAEQVGVPDLVDPGSFMP